VTVVLSVPESNEATRSFGEREDRVTSVIETQTAKIPSSGYLAAAIGAMGASGLFKILGKDDWALFVGQWAPAFLIMGVYNKMVKQRAGAALDPELLLFGVHSQFGPIFHRDVSFRPNAEFAFGEVTDLIALNLEAIYRLPISARRGNWLAYVGAGPGFTFLHQNFERQQGQGRNIDSGNFDFDPSFNVLTGLQFRRGTLSS